MKTTKSIFFENLDTIVEVNVSENDCLREYNAYATNPITKFINKEERISALEDIFCSAYPVNHLGEDINDSNLFQLDDDWAENDESFHIWFRVDDVGQLIDITANDIAYIKSRGENHD